VLPMKPAKSRNSNADRRGEEACHRLIQAGIEVFSTHGYEAASTRLLAEKAGVNLSAIPYYFGNKEGLYHAIVEHVVAIMREPLMPLIEHIETALEREHLLQTDVINLLHELLDGFVVSVIVSESDRWGQIFLREQLEPTSAFDIFYEQVTRHLLHLCTRLIARLLDKPETDRECSIHAFAILGSILIFRTNRASVLRSLEWEEFNAERIESIQLVVRQHITAILPPK
jgi:TetR/AcrR family transcriptional regulator, regulator of cefoperazone and chloramphenicol sensitivity